MLIEGFDGLGCSFFIDGILWSLLLLGVRFVVDLEEDMFVVLLIEFESVEFFDVVVFVLLLFEFLVEE